MIPIKTLRRGIEYVARLSLDRLTKEVGGAARRRAVVILACILGLDAADKGVVGALAFDLEHSLRVGNAQVGLIVTVSSLVGALATIPVGSLTDRSRRVRLLWVSIILWAIAQLSSGLSPSYGFLLGSQVLLGAITATAGPTVASLTGDLFPVGDRGRMYGFILTGESLGAGAGVLIAGLAAAWFGWRAAFFVLVIPGLALAWAVHRFLPEPARGGQSRIAPGATEIIPVEEVEAQAGRTEPEPAGSHRDVDLVLEEVERRGFEPDESIVLNGDPSKTSLWEAIRYVLRVRTNVILIIASSLGYFFFAGLETFAIIFVRGHFGIGQGAATMIAVAVGIGVVVGLIVAGNIGDALIRRGRINGRLLVGAVGFIVGSFLLAPGLISPLLYISVPLFVMAGAMVSAPNPGLDAARLDVVPAGMWGRAEGVRTFLRQGLEAFAPLLFGLMSEIFGDSSAGIGSGVNLRGAASQSQARGLEYTFLIMLVPVVAGGLILLKGRSSYAVDVASAGESDRRIAGDVWSETAERDKKS